MVQKGVLGNDFADQIIIVSFGNAHLVKVADFRCKIFRHIVDQDIAVNFLGLALCSSLKEKIGFLRNTFEKNLKSLADL
jgi:hypothetical protein